MSRYTCSVPETLEGVLAILKDQSKKNTVLLAGGTDFVPRLNRKLEQIPDENDNLETHIVYLGKLGYNTVELIDGMLRIGAMCTLADVLSNPLVAQKVPALADALKKLADVSVRNIATIGGNICNASPAADCVPPLLVHDAKFVLAGPNNERTVAAADFFTGPGKTARMPDEMLLYICIPDGKGNSGFYKLGRRKAETLSVVNAAAYVELENGVCRVVRLAVGAVAPTPLRCEAVEKRLVGKPLTPSLLEEECKCIIETIKPIDDIRASAWYRSRVAPVILGRALKSACNFE